MGGIYDYLQSAIVLALSLRIVWYHTYARIEMI